jgi:hypothetical protein
MGTAKRWVAEHILSYWLWPTVWLHLCRLIAETPHTLATRVCGQVSCLGILLLMFSRCGHATAPSHRMLPCLCSITFASRCCAVCCLSSGPRRPGEGVENEEQGIISAEMSPTGAVTLRITLLAAGFIIGGWPGA